MIIGQLQQAIVKAVKKATNLSLKPEEVFIEHPENISFGDYSTNIALVLSSRSKDIKPHQLTSEIKQFLEKQRLDFIDKISVVNNFINISVKNEYFIKQLQQVLKEAKDYGKNQTGKNKTIMVEYAHPNTHKAFHIGHLRNIINGQAIVRILEASGFKLIRANYQGDVGLHIAKCLWQIKKQKANLKTLKTLDKKTEFLSKAYVKGNKAYEEDEKAKKEILVINKQIYDKDPAIKPLWQKTRQWSLDYFERIYKRVDTYFDRYYFEGEVAQPGKEIVLKALKKGIFKKSKGAIIFPGSEHGLHDRVFITAEGNPTYEAKDMELGRLQFKKYHPDLVIHNVGPEQAGYFKVVFKALAQIFPFTKDKEYHLIYGWVRLKKGKMSSRLGNIVLGEWLLDEAKKRIKKDFSIDEKTAEIIAVGAVKYSFLKVHPPTEIAFDFDESISLEGNSGPYLQYTYARCQSVLKKAQSKPQTLKLSSYQPNTEELVILRHFYKFPEIVFQAGKEYSPNLIANFLYELSQKYNGFYNKHRVIGNNFRLVLTAATAQIIKNGLDVLAIKVPAKM